jgi:hypothetical protein
MKWRISVQVESDTAMGLFEKLKSISSHSGSSETGAMCKNQRRASWITYCNDSLLDWSDEEWKELGEALNDH